MDLNSILRRFLFRNSDSNHDIFDTNDNPRNKRSNITDNDDDFRDFDQHMHMFHEMRKMFDSVFMPPVGIMIGFPNIDEHHVPRKKSPRSIMLKDNEEEPGDPFFCKKNLQTGLCSCPEKEEPDIKAPSFSYSKFSSFKTVRLSDGTVEEHRTVIDNSGNKITTVRHAIGDTSHEVIIKSDKKGIKEKEENFMNMDENDLGNFEQKWNKVRSGVLVEPSIPSLKLPPSNPTFWNLFKKFFGSSKDC